jgi:integrase
MAKGKALLTDASLRGATLEKDGRYLRDGGGLRVRLLPPSAQHPKGARLFEYHFKVKAGDEWKHGQLHLGTYGDTVTDASGRRHVYGLERARADCAAARALVAQGIDPREARRLRELEEQAEQRRKLAEHHAQANRRSVKAAFESWRALYLVREHKDGGALVESHFGRHILPVLGEKALQDVGKADIVPILDGLVGAGRLRTANALLALLRQFFRWCMARDWIDREPTFGLSKAAVGGTEAPRERNLSFDELAALPDRMAAAKLPERVRHAVWLLAATGARVGELSGARLAEFDFEACEWRIPAERSKNGLAHLVHLSAFAIEHAQALMRAGTDAKGKPAELILPGRDRREPIDDKTVAKLVRDRQRARRIKGRSKKAGELVLPGGEWTPHDLRRTMASRMGDLGIRPDVIERCLNHKPEGLVAVYQRAELLPERKAAFERWGDKLASTLRGEQPTPVVDLAAAKKRRARRVAA